MQHGHLPATATMEEENVRCAPEILKHVIDGFVILESSEPFKVTFASKYFCKKNRSRHKDCEEPPRMYFTVVCNVYIDGLAILFYR